jgi:hypothetical protein
MSSPAVNIAAGVPQVSVKQPSPIEGGVVLHLRLTLTKTTHVFFRDSRCVWFSTTYFKNVVENGARFLLALLRWQNNCHLIFYNKRILRKFSVKVVEFRPPKARSVAGIQARFSSGLSGCMIFCHIFLNGDSKTQASFGVVENRPQNSFCCMISCHLSRRNAMSG